MSDDHVPPEKLFGKPRPPGLVAVPSCIRCNDAASLDDEYFKTTMALRRDIRHHPVIQQIRPSVLRSFLKPAKKRFAKAFLSTFRRVDFPGTEDGPTAVLTYDVHLYRLYRVIVRTTHGFFFKEVGEPINRSCFVGVVGDKELEEADPEFQEQVRLQFARIPMTTIGSGVFSFRAVRDRTDPRLTVWLMTFYRRVTFLSATLPH